MKLEGYNYILISHASASTATICIQYFKYKVFIYSYKKDQSYKLGNEYYLHP